MAWYGLHGGRGFRQWLQDWLYETGLMRPNARQKIYIQERKDFWNSLDAKYQRKQAKRYLAEQ